MAETAAMMPFLTTILAQGALSVVQGTISAGQSTSSAISGFISSMQATLANIYSTLGTVIGYMNAAYTQIGNLFNKLKFLELIAFIVIIGKCFFKFINMLVDTLTWLFVDFPKWLFWPWPKNLFDVKLDVNNAGFIPWIVRFFMCTAYKIAHFPKCFLWYTLDTLGWILYLPFKFIFWMMDSILGIGLVDKEHAAWKFFDEIDYFIHGPMDNWFKLDYVDGENMDTTQPDPENSLNLGFHLIHFPDSVMETCYGMKYAKLESLRIFPIKKFMEFMTCAVSPF